MMILMTHPKHGAMHVYTEAEIALNEKNGWMREGFAPVPRQANPDLVKLYTEKYGHAPKDGMTDDQILAEIKAEPSAEAATAAEVENPAEDIDVLRSAWEVKFGKPADKRKGIAKLRRELKE